MIDHGPWQAHTREQLGLITRPQALESGLSEATIHRLVRRGTWEPMQAGVYRVGGAPASEDQTLLGACLGLRPLVAVSHRAAVARWGYRLARAAPLEVSVDRERGIHLDDIQVHRSRDLHPDHVDRLGPLPITTPTRTLVDLGQVVPWFIVRDVLEYFVARRVVSIDQAHLALLLHSRRGRHGCGALRRVLEQRALLDRPTDSVLEAAFAQLCAAHGLPRPAYQFTVAVADGERRIDFAYPDLLLAIEVDGFETHATVGGFTSDRVRGNELALLGWTVLHFTWHQVLHRPGYVARTITQARAHAAERNRVRKSLSR